MGMKQLPGFLRRALDLPERFRKGHALFMPIEVEECMNDVLERMVAGSTRTLQNAGSMKPQVLLQTASKLLKSWRDLYLKSCEENGIKPKECRENKPNNQWLSRFLYRWQWSWQASNTKGSYLPNDSEEMIEMRKTHQAQRLIEKAPWSMTLNFDQMWRAGYEPPSKVLHKRRGKRHANDDCELSPEDVVGKRLEAVLQVVEGEMQRRMGRANKSKVRKTVARTDHVQGGRIGMTAISSTWGNGELGPLGICVATGQVRPSLITDINAAYHGHVFIFESGTESNFDECRDNIALLAEPHWASHFVERFRSYIYIYMYIYIYICIYIYTYIYIYVYIYIDR